MISCPFCYGINEDGAKFCEYCGKRLDAAPQEEAQEVKETAAEDNVSDSATEIDWNDLTSVLGAEAEKTEEPVKETVQEESPVVEREPEKEVVEEPWKQRRLEQEKKAAERNAKTVSIKVPEKVKNVDIKSAVSKGTKKPGMGVILAETAVLLILIIAFAVLGSSYSNPKNVAKKYMESMFKNDWESAYECLDIQPGSFLTKEGYAALYEGDAFRVDVTNMKVTEQKSFNKDAFITYCDVEYRLRGSSEVYYYTVTLVKQDVNNMLFFPSWKVASNEAIVYAYPINVPHGSQVTFDGVLLTDNHLNVSNNAEGMDQYQIDAFAGDHKIQVAAPWCEVQEYDVNVYEGDTFYANNISLVEGAEEILVGQASDALAKLYEAAMKDADYSEVSDLFASDMSDRYEAFKEDVIGQEDYTMTELSIDGFEAEEAYYMSDADYGSGLCVWINYDYEYDYTYIYRGWFSSKSEVRHDSDYGWSGFTAAFIWDEDGYKVNWIDANSVF